MDWSSVGVSECGGDDVADSLRAEPDRLRAYIGYSARRSPCPVGLGCVGSEQFVAGRGAGSEVVARDRSQDADAGSVVTFVGHRRQSEKRRRTAYGSEVCRRLT